MRVSKTSRALELAAVCVLLWALAVVLQWRAGAFAAEFSSHPDEAAHYITGLMIRDFIASGHYGAPLTYAEHYYAHYPKVAFGMWPPFFHTVEAAWMLLFSPDKVSVLLLTALITAMTGASIYFLLRASHSIFAAMTGGALYIMLPLVQASTATVMADGLVTLLELWAAIWLMRYIGSERTRYAVLFGVFAALSMATKANGVAMVLLPVVMLALTRSWHLLRARGLYYAVGIVLVLGAPWPALSYWMIERSMGGEAVTAGVISGTAVAYLRVLWATLGWGIAPFCAAGIALLAVRRRRGRSDLTLAGAFALLCSVWAYHVLIGNGADRYMIAALPGAVILAVAGFQWIARGRRVVGAVLGVGAAGLFCGFTWTTPHKQHQGFDQAAEYLMTHAEFAGGNFLVVSHARGEGAFITEVAMRDRRPGHFVLRSTKLLSSSNWYGSEYRLRYQGTEGLRKLLDQAPIDAVVLDTRPAEAQTDAPACELERAVGGALAGDPNWRLREQFPSRIDLYSRVGPQPAGQVTLDLRYTLGKEIVVGKPAK